MIEEIINKVENLQKEEIIVWFYDDFGNDDFTLINKDLLLEALNGEKVLFAGGNVISIDDIFDVE